MYSVKKFFPTEKWMFPVLISLGVFSGLIVHILYLSKAHSYLSDEPGTCINCHIMAPQYITWSRSSHRMNSTCNDCHVPHNNVINKYFYKAKDGLRHASMFTLRLEPQVIKMHEGGQAVVQENCKRCHSHLNEMVSVGQATFANSLSGENRLCWDCHREVPHGRVKSISSVPNARVPLLKSPLPDLFKELNK